MTDEEKNITDPEEKPEDKPEDQPNEKTESDLIADVKASYEERIAQIKAEYDARLKERDKVIKQLIKEEKDNPPPTDGIVEKINSRRNYKKW